MFLSLLKICYPYFLRKTCYLLQDLLVLLLQSESVWDLSSTVAVYLVLTPDLATKIWSVKRISADVPIMSTMTIAPVFVSKVLTLDVMHNQYLLCISLCMCLSSLAAGATKNTSHIASGASIKSMEGILPPPALLLHIYLWLGIQLRGNPG